MKNFLAILMLAPVLLAGLDAAAAAQWRFEKVRRLDTAVQTAWVANEEGYRFSIVQGDGGRVTAIFQIPEESPVLLGTSPPVYRVDGREQRPVSAWGIYVEMDAKQVSWFIWDGTGDPCDPAPPARERAEALCEIMRGDEIVFEYYRITGEAERTRFPLAGSSRAIRALLNE